MKFHLGCELDYTVAPPATMFLSLRPRQTAGVKVIREKLEIKPDARSVVAEDRVEENHFERISPSLEGDLFLRYHAEVNARHRLIPAKKLRAANQAPLDGSVLPWLFPSRYCQSDLLGRLASQKFGKHRSSLDQARAITEWIHSHVDYVRGATNSATSARDTLTECAGVCRDFAHLGIALCRALSIPARYVTGYAHRLDPPDFHAFFEVLIGNDWILLDATYLAPMNGVVLIGVGRDAADVSVCTTFGTATSQRQAVWCDADKDFKPVRHNGDVLVSLNRAGK